MNEVMKSHGNAIHIKIYLANAAHYRFLPNRILQIYARISEPVDH